MIIFQETSVATSRPATLPGNNASPLSISQTESPSSSTTSSLLMSLFGRGQTSSSSPHLSSPTRVHGPISKIPSFRINRIPQARPIGREAVNRRLKRDAKTKEYEVANKVAKIEDDERTVKESESESESESETERGLLASRSEYYFH